MAEASKKPEPAEEPSELAFATVEELIDELFKRHRAMIFCGEQLSKDGKGTVTLTKWAGSINHAIGLASRTHGKLLARGLAPTPGDEEGDEG